MVLCSKLKVDPAANAMQNLYFNAKGHQKIFDEHITETKALIKKRLRATFFYF